MRRKNAVIVLNVLSEGHRINKDGKVFCLSQAGELCQVVPTEESEVLLKVNFGDFRLHSFINWCNTFTEEEMVDIAFSSALGEMK
jgi:hypothetical protein